MKLNKHGLADLAVVGLTAIVGLAVLLFTGKLHF